MKAIKTFIADIIEVVFTITIISSILLYEWIQNRFKQ